MALLFTRQTAMAQPISGTVKDTRGLPLRAVSLSIQNSYDGTVTDSTGYFSFSTDHSGSLVLEASATGYRSFSTVVKKGERISIVLKETITELKAVVITAGSFEAGDKKKATVLSTIDILTTASANADVTGAVRTLPGAQQVGESEGLFVRGGTSSETKTYIDGSLVNNFFYSSVPGIAQRGRFSPFLFKGTVFSSGGYSALYGQALSSVLMLESIDLPSESSASLGASVIGVNGGYQKLSKNKRSSWGGSYAYTDLRLAFAILDQEPEYFRVPSYHTGDANFRIKTSAGGMLKYYGYFSTNRLGLRYNSIDTLGYKDAFSLKNANTYHNLSWKENFGRNWKISTGISFTTNNDLIKGELQQPDNSEANLQGLEQKNFDLDAKGRYLNFRTVAEYRLRGLSALRFGGEHQYSREHAEYFDHNGNQYPQTITENLDAAFAETDIYLTNDLAAKAGLRTEHSQRLSKTNLAPRLSLAYKLGTNSQASVAYGQFYQSPEMRYLVSAAPIDYARATHYIAQYQKTTAKQTLRAEIFYKRYDQLLKTGVVNGRQEPVSVAGRGHAQGFELFWRDRQSIKNFDYWVSYSYLDTRRDHLNYPSSIRPSFAAAHTASLVVKKFVTRMKTQFNGSYTYASGRPYYDIRTQQGGNKYMIADQGYTMDYNSLSVSVNYLPNIFKKGAGKYSVLVFSWTNVLGSKQVYGYKYAYDGSRKEAIVPPSRSFLFLGAFFSFGVDRSQESINANL